VADLFEPSCITIQYLLLCSTKQVLTVLNFYSRQITVSIKICEISFGIKYSVHDLIYYAHFCA